MRAGVASRLAPARIHPPELIAEAADVQDADKRLRAFYAENWPWIEKSLQASVDESDVDLEAKEAFAECLRAHTLGLYRVAPAVLFPQIERVARGVLLPNAMGASAANQLFEALGRLGASEFTVPGVSGVRMYKKLAEHPPPWPVDHHGGTGGSTLSCQTG